MVFPFQTPLDSAVAQAAKALAHTLQATPEWEEWRSAEAAFEGDAELCALMDRYRILAERWRSARANGKPLPGEDAMEVAEVEEKIRGHRLFARRQRAIEELTALFLETNQVVTEALGIDFAANAVPRGGGGCCG